MGRSLFNADGAKLTMTSRVESRQLMLSPGAVLERSKEIELIDRNDASQMWTIFLRPKLRYRCDPHN